MHYLNEKYIYKAGRKSNQTWHSTSQRLDSTQSPALIFFSLIRTPSSLLVAERCCIPMREWERSSLLLRMSRSGRALEMAALCYGPAAASATGAACCVFLGRTVCVSVEVLCLHSSWIFCPETLLTFYFHFMMHVLLCSILLLQLCVTLLYYLHWRLTLFLKDWEFLGSMLNHVLCGCAEF